MFEQRRKVLIVNVVHATLDAVPSTEVAQKLRVVAIRPIERVVLYE